MSKALPKKVLIGGKTYKIKKKIKINHPDKKYVWGQVNTALNTILLNKSIALENQEETLLHEILHAISDDQRAKLSENQVIKLTRGLYLFFKENRYKF